VNHSGGRAACRRRVAVKGIFFERGKIPSLITVRKHRKVMPEERGEGDYANEAGTRKVPGNTD
jgi:hypothetical protein